MIAVVVPNWNGAEFLKECLKSLQGQTYKDFEVVVVDNGSVDGSKELIAGDFPQAKLIELERNYGFAGGVNRGIRYALDHDMWGVALFNNDAVADKDWLRHLVETIEPHKKVGAVASQFLSLDGETIDSIGDYYSVWGLPFPKGRGLPRQHSTAVTEVFSASGGASLYRSELFRDIGLFDEDFFAYYEDIDISFRARLAGWKVLYQPSAVAYHHIGGTSSKHSGFSRYHSIKNMFFVYAKNMPGWLFWKYLVRFWIVAGLVAFNSVRNKQTVPMLKAWGVAGLYWPKMLVKRWSIQHKRRVSASEIDRMLYHSLPPTQVKTIRAFGKLPILSRWLTEEPVEDPLLD